MRPLVLLAALLTVPALAQDAEKLPLWGGGVRALHALGGDRVLAVHASPFGDETVGLSRSDDAGRSWRRIEPASSLGPVAVGDDGVIYLGTEPGASESLLRSTDAGDTWEPVATPDGFYLRRLVAGPAGAVVAVGGWPAHGGDRVLWVTYDAGATWAARSIPTDLGDPVIHERDLFAIESGYGGGRLHTLANGADAWDRVPLAVSNSADVVYWTRDGVLYTARYAYPGPTGAYMDRSDDGVATWTATGWGDVGGLPGDLRCEGTTCYAVFFGGLYFDPGGLAIFEGDERPPRGALPQAVDPTAVVTVGGRLLVGDVGGRGVYASDDGGRTWAISNVGMDRPDVRAVAVESDRIWAVGEGFRGPNRVLRTGPGGEWLDVGPGWDEYGEPPFFGDLEMFGGDAFLPNGKGVLSTTDGDAYRPWSVDGGRATRLMRLPGRLAAASQGRLFVTADGVAWAEIPFELPIDGRLSDSVADAVEVGGALVVSVEGSHPGAETGRGIWRSEDGGLTWARALDDPARPSVGALVALADGVVVAATPDGLLRSTDGGRSFAEAAGPAGVHTLVASGPAAYAATEAALFRTLDGGATWAPFVDLGETVRDLAVDPRGRLLVATADGLFRVVDTSVEVAPGPMAGPGPLSVTVGPNPTAGAATVRLTLPTPAVVRVDVFDALGRRVAGLPARVTSVGPQAWTVGTAGLAPGVYLVRVRAGVGGGAMRLTVR